MIPMPIYVCGFGGFAKETYWHIKELESNLAFKVMGFIDKMPDDLKCKLKNYYHGVPIFNENVFDFNDKNIVIAIGDPKLRYKIYRNIVRDFKNVSFPSIISPFATILSVNTVIIGEGCIICANCILTCDTTIGGFVHLNLGTTIGHDVIMNDFITTAPLVSINGKVIVESGVYFGTNSCTVENIKICHDSIIGAGAVITKDITETGTYVGIPAKKLMKG